MAIAANRFNDPALGQAFANLSSMFAPPSGSDLSGYATAAAKKAEAARLAELFNYAKSPNFDQAMFDRMGVAGDLFDPSQSYYSVDTDARTRLGMNAADNARALQANQADNARALEQTRLGNTKDITTSLLAPVPAGGTRFVPSSIGDMFNLPPTQTGVLSANPGEIVRAPDGTTLNGAPKPLNESEVLGAILQGMPLDQQRAVAGKDGVIKLGQGEIAQRVDGTTLTGPAKPLSESEWKAQQNERLLAEGDMTDQMMVDMAFGDNAPVKVVDAQGRISYMSAGEAARTGATAYVDKGSEAKATNGTALLPDGKQVPAVQGEDKRWYYAQQPGMPLPDGTRIFGTPQAVGTAADIGLAPTVANTTDANRQEAEVTRALNVLDLYENLIRNNPGSIGLAALIKGTSQDIIATANDLAASFGKDSAEIRGAAEDIRNGLSAVAPEYMGAIPEAEFLQGTLAYALARTENPSGEVSRQAFERALDRVKGGGLLANSQSAMAAIGANRKVLQTQLEGIRTTRSPGTGRTDTSFQPPPDAPAGGTTRLRFDANGDPIQ